jgi:hypothetical protein
MDDLIKSAFNIDLPESENKVLKAIDKSNALTIALFNANLEMTQRILSVLENKPIAELVMECEAIIRESIEKVDTIRASKGL